MAHYDLQLLAGALNKTVLFERLYSNDLTFWIEMVDRRAGVRLGQVTKIERSDWLRLG